MLENGLLFCVFTMFSSCCNAKQAYFYHHEPTRVCTLTRYDTCSNVWDLSCPFECKKRNEYLLLSTFPFFQQSVASTALKTTQGKRLMCSHSGSWGFCGFCGFPDRPRKSRPWFNLVFRQTSASLELTCQLHEHPARCVPYVLAAPWVGRERGQRFYRSGVSLQ